jgi:hypothetical protein
MNSRDSTILEDAQAFCEKDALDVERALRGDAGAPESPLI